MRKSLDRIAKIIFVCGILCASVHVQPAWAASQLAEQETLSTEQILSSIADIRNADDRGVVRQKAFDLAHHIRETIDAGQGAAITERVIQALGDLLDNPVKRFDTATIIIQIGPRASALRPKLNAVLEDEYQKEKGDIVAQPIDSIDMICTALREVKSQEPRICLDRNIKW